MSAAQRFARWVFFGALYIAMPIAALAVLNYFDQPYEVSEDYRVTSADWVVSMANEPPASGWQALGAESSPQRGQSHRFTSVWFRIRVPDGVNKPALLIPFPNGNYDVWLNDQRMLKTGAMHRPLYFKKQPIVVPLGSTNPGVEREIFLRLARQSSNPTISYAYIAPVEDALLDANGQLIIQRHVPLVILAIMATFGLSVSLMFFLRRRHTAYGWYALTLLFWGLHTAHAIYQGVPFHHFVWYGINYLLLSWLIAELFFVNRYFDIPAPRWERAITVITVVLSAILIGVAVPALDSAAFESYYRAQTTVVGFWFLFIAFVVSSRYFVAIRKSWTFDSVSLWLASAVVIGVGIRDLMFELGLFNLSGTVYYLQFVAVIPLLLFGIQLMRRFANDSRQAEQLNEELQRVVASRTADLELTSRRLTHEERRRVLAEERSRLMRDMHDGLGGQLVNALALSEQGKDRDLERSLRVALDDLRLIVDSLSPSENSLQDLLASYRHRVSKMLQRTGFTVDWQLADCATQIELKPNTALSILRIMQEAVTNAVRHSGGGHLVIRLCETEDQLQLSVTDNGSGIEAGVAERGLRNMRVRADEIGADLKIITKPGQTRVQVSLPLDFRDVTVF